MANLGINTFITQRTAINEGIIKQSFYEIRPSDFFPVLVGQNAWSDSILFNREYNISSDFSSPI